MLINSALKQNQNKRHLVLFNTELKEQDGGKGKNMRILEAVSPFLSIIIFLVANKGYFRKEINKSV